MTPRRSGPGGDSDSSPGRSKPPAHSKINTVIENGGRFLGANLQDLSATACLDYSSKTGAGHFPKAPKPTASRWSASSLSGPFGMGNMRYPQPTKQEGLNATRTLARLQLDRGNISLDIPFYRTTWGSCFRSNSNFRRPKRMGFWHSFRTGGIQRCGEQYSHASEQC